MPLYTYRCSDCGRSQEHYVPMDTETVTCRWCDAPAERDGPSMARPITFNPYRLELPGGVDGYGLSPPIDERTDKQLKALARNNPHQAHEYEFMRDNHKSRSS